MRLYWLVYNDSPGIVAGVFRMAADYDEAYAIGHWLYGNNLLKVVAA